MPSGHYHNFWFILGIIGQGQPGKNNVEKENARRERGEVGGETGWCGARLAELEFN